MLQFSPALFRPVISPIFPYSGLKTVTVTVLESLSTRQKPYTENRGELFALSTDSKGSGGNGIS
jgi:hypothetical protein